MTAVDLHLAIAAKPGAKAAPSSSNFSPAPPREKQLPNPQQGMADQAASASANTAGAATSTNTACTSPLTVTSLEAAAATTAAAVAAGGVPQVVSQVVAKEPPPPAAVDSMLEKLSLGPPLPQVAAPVPHRPAEEKKMRLRTPPTERDSRKLFVGGLPTDVSDREFLEFFQQFGEVIDSVVIIDRMTKRSRGFGFVTFATEKDANSLLTAIPGKTGYVIINGKQCEVKASTPKADDGTYKRGHQHNTMWRSDPPRHGHGGFVPRHPINHGSRVAAPMKQQQTYTHQQPHAGKNYTLDSNYNGDVDGRNFDQLHQPTPQMNASYMYSRGLPSTNQHLYQYNQNAYPPGARSYTYPNSSGASAASLSSWDSSYPPAQSQGYGQYPSSSMSATSGYYDTYAAQHYSSYYGGSNSAPPHMTMGGYANFGGNGMEEGSGDENYEPYPQAYSEDSNYEDVGQYD